MPVRELGHHIGTTGEEHVMVVSAPALDVLARVSPQEVPHEACVVDVCWSHDVPDMLYALGAGTRSSVTAYFVVDDGSDVQAAGTVGEGLPELEAVPALALVAEAVDAVDSSVLVVAPQEEELLPALDLVRHQAADCPEGLPAPNHVEPEKELVVFRGEAAVLENTQERPSTGRVCLQGS